MEEHRMRSIHPSRCRDRKPLRYRTGPYQPTVNGRAGRDDHPDITQGDQWWYKGKNDLLESQLLPEHELKLSFVLFWKALSINIFQ
jgi:hypothetical protein